MCPGGALFAGKRKALASARTITHTGHASSEACQGNGQAPGPPR